MNVTNNHFGGDFLHLNKKSSRFKIATELPFQDRESVFNELTSPIFFIIELTSHFLTVFTADGLIMPGTYRDDGFCMKIFTDLTVYLFGVISFIHDVTIRLSDFMALSEEFLGMPGIMDPAV